MIYRWNESEGYFLFGKRYMSMLLERKIGRDIEVLEEDVS